jgi:hypothetical protein
MRLARAMIALPLSGPWPISRKRSGNIILDVLPGLIVALGDLFDFGRRQKN